MKEPARIADLSLARFKHTSVSAGTRVKTHMPALPLTTLGPSEPWFFKTRSTEAGNWGFNWGLRARISNHSLKLAVRPGLLPQLKRLLCALHRL